MSNEAAAPTSTPQLTLASDDKDLAGMHGTAGFCVVGRAFPKWTRKNQLPGD
jgi:hypothetical protein